MASPSSARVRRSWRWKGHEPTKRRIQHNYAKSYPMRHDSSVTPLWKLLQFNSHLTLTSDCQLTVPLISQRLFPFLCVSCMIRTSYPCIINHVDNIIIRNQNSRRFRRRLPLVSISLLNSPPVSHQHCSHSDLSLSSLQSTVCIFLRTTSKEHNPSLKSKHFSPPQEAQFTQTERFITVFKKSPPLLPKLS